MTKAIGQSFSALFLFSVFCWFLFLFTFINYFVSIDGKHLKIQNDEDSFDTDDARMKCWRYHSLLFELEIDFPGEKPLEVQREQKPRKVNQMKKAKNGKKKAEVQEGERNTEKSYTEVEEALILAWREDPGIKWVSEQSECIMCDVLSHAKKSQAGKGGWITFQASMKCPQIGLGNYHLKV